MNLYFICGLFLITFVLCSTIASSEQDYKSIRACKNDIQCTPNSYCNGSDTINLGICQCIDGFELDETEEDYQCHKTASIGESCEESFQCYQKGGVYAECINSICQCIPDSINDESFCIAKIPLNSSCFDSKECSWIPNSDCLDGFCKCQKNFIPSVDQKRCHLNATLGEKCTNDDDCNSEHCNGIVCVCKQDFFISRDEKECLPVAAIGEPCKERIQCLANGGVRADCIDQICQCEESSNPNELGPGTTTKLNLNSFCMTNDSCNWILNASCLKGKCDCEENMKPSSDLQRCLFNATLGEKCSSDKDCNDENLHCKNVCVCKPEFVSATEAPECLPVARYFETSCIGDAQCGKHMHLSICTNGKCVCPNGLEQIGSNCVHSADDVDCLSDFQCAGFGRGAVKCIKGKCMCIYGKIDENRCKSEQDENEGNGSRGLVNVFPMYFLWFTCVCLYHLY